MVISLCEKKREYKERISKKFMVILNYYFEDYFDQNPEEASSLGLSRHDAQIKDYSNEAYDKELQLNLDTKKKLRMINPYNLSIEEHADFVLLNSRLDAFIYNHENLPQARKNNPMLYLPIDGIYSLLFRTMKESTRLNKIISRLSQVQRLIDQAKQNLDNPPRIWTETTIKQLKYVIQFFNKLPEFDVIKNSEKDNAELVNSLKEVNKTCIAALNDYDRFLNVELIEKSHGVFCIGRQALDFYLKNNHFLEHASGYINELGYKLIDKTESDIESFTSHIDKTKKPEEILKEIEDDFIPADKLLNTYKQLVDKTRLFVIDNDLVTFPEGETLDVIETPEYFRDIMPFAAYFTLGVYDESNTGQFWVTPVNEEDKEKELQLLKDGHNINRLPSIVLHESYPGHHLQFKIAKKVLFADGISTMRRVVFNNFFIEGWALYCEQMMGEYGFYSEKQNIMMLKQRLWRDVRIVLDIELHTGRKSFEEAVAFMMNKLNMSESFARAEVTRYTMTPTQPMSYEIGRRLINQLRDKEKIRLRDDFSIKDFHDKLLSKGPLPIKILEELLFNQKVEVLT